MDCSASYHYVLFVTHLSLHKLRNNIYDYQISPDRTKGDGTNRNNYKMYTDMAFANHVSHRHCNKYDAKNNLSPFPLTDMVASDKCIRFYVISF